MVDDIDKPNIIYGICNGKGDFLRKTPLKYKRIFKKHNFKQTYDVRQGLSKKKIETRRIWRPLNL